MYIIEFEDATPWHVTYWVYLVSVPPSLDHCYLLL